MFSPDTSLPLIVLIGPTAVGKTELSIQLAKRLDGEIVSADSRLFYRGMNIGTAKPGSEERAGVPHHLIDVADPDDVWSLAVFQEAAHSAIAGIHARRRLPFLVGGTGQYVCAITEGWSAPAVKPDPRLRAALEAWGTTIGSAGLHHHLHLLDPDAAAKIDHRNVRRTIRALEVVLTTGQRFSAQRQRQGSPYNLLQIGLTRPRAELYARIDTRIQAMLDAGFEAEVRTLLQRGYSPALPTLSAIGYREMIAYIQGRMTLDEAVIQMKRISRQFVRRQANWFKAGDPDIHWFQAGESPVDEIERLIRKFVNRQKNG